MTIQHLYPTTRPSLDLNFARTKRLDPRVTFTRGSTATYVGSDGLIKTAASNEARFDHDPATGESLGLLVEESRTNLATYSEQFDDAAWIKLGTTISANSTTAPNGTTTADKLVSNNASNRFAVYRYLTMTANKVQTFSCYGKASEWNFMTLVISKQGSPYTRDSYTIDLSSGAVNKGPWTSNSVVSTSFAAQKLANGWWRLSVSVKLDASSTDLHLEIGTSPTDQYNNGMPGDGTSGIFIWGAQWEQDASFPTSYIPTSGSTVTRSADVASMTASPYLYGTFLAKYKHQPPTGLYRQIFSVGNASAYGAFVCRTQPNDTVNIVLPGIVDLTTTTNTGTSGFNNVATARVLGNYAVCLNGGTVAKTSSTSDNTNNSVITFMYGTTGATSGGHISRLTYYPTRLTDAQLQALTL